MQHHYCFEFVDCLLHKLQSSTELFDRISFLLDESVACSLICSLLTDFLLLNDDFAQILPVIFCDS